jgi:Flp pilus assembly protein TadD
MCARFCEQCGAPLKPDTEFCEECGAPLAVQPPSPPSPQQKKPAPVIPTPGPIKRSPSFPLLYMIIGVVVVIAIIAAAVLLPGHLSLQPDGGVGAPVSTTPPAIKVSVTNTTSNANATEVNSILSKGALDVTAEEVDRIIAMSPDDDRVWVRKGFFEEYRDNYTEAIAAFNRSIELAPAKNKWLLFHIGTNHNRLGQYEEALKIWDQIFALNYLDRVNILMHEVWNQKGISLSGLGRYEEAIKAFDMAISLYPEHEFAWNGKGEALEKLGRNSEAAIAYKKALEINPTYETARVNLANLQAK